MIAHLFLRIKKIFPLLAVLAATGMLAWLAYGFRHAPVLYSDDWTYIIGEYTRGDLQWFDWAGSRPLLDMPFSVLTSLFGLNIRAFYVVLMALHALAALQFYWLLRRIGLRERGIALGIALLFMVYPADYTHMWLTMINVWVCMNLLLGYAHLLLTFTRTGSAWAILAALAALLVSLGIYEAQLGLALLWPLLLLVLNRDIPRVRKALLLTPMLIGPVFAAWRMLGAPAIGITDPYVQRVELSPFVLLSRLWASSKLLLLWDWAIPVLRALDTQNNWLAWAIIGALVGLCWLIAAMLLRRRESWQGQEVAGSLQDVHRSLALAAAGLTLILAGYVPAIILSGATLYSIASRVHLFASIGASVFIAAILFGISSLVCHLRPCVGWLTLAGLAPLIILGTTTQAWVQSDNRVAWQEQTDIWQNMFLLCPDFEENTTIYVVMPGLAERGGWATWQRPPFSGPGEITSSLQVLYGQRSLHGDVIYPDLDRGASMVAPVPTWQGIVNSYTQRFTPYNEAVFFRYDGTPRRLRIIEDLHTELQFPSNPTEYAPETRCLPRSTPDIDLRRLVTRGDLELP